MANLPNHALTRLPVFERENPDGPDLRWALNSANPNGHRHPLRKAIVRIEGRLYVDRARYAEIVAALPSLADSEGQG